MTKLTKNRKEWRVSRHCAGAKRRYRTLTHIPFKRLRFFQREGYCINSMGLCYQRQLKLRLGNRKVCAIRYIIVVVKEEE